MARKQTEYLASLLEDDPSPPSPAPTNPDRQRGTTLLGRESALARLASGEVRQVTQLHLDPCRVRVWSGNARAYEHLNEDNCRELLDSIVAEGGQKVPAVVRRVADDPEHDFEVIAGTRRHWCVSWLRRHSYPDFAFVATVASLDDEAAFRLADIENRARKDVSDLERARNYAAALKDHYGGHQTRMAERLRLSKGWLSKLLRVASLPDVVVDAFASPSDVAVKPAYPLATAVEDEDQAPAILEEAAAVASEQRALRDASEQPIVATEVIRRLLGAPTAAAQAMPRKPAPFVWNSKFDRPALSVTSANRQGVTVRVHAGSGATNSELQRALKDALDHLQQDGLWSS